MMERAERIVFFLLVFFTSSQVGLHFWPEFSYVHGIRVDYLSPTLYLIDIFIFTLLVLSITRLKKIFAILKFDKTLNILLLLFVLSLAWGIFSAKSPGAHIFGLIKLIEFVFLGLYVAASFKRSYIKPFVGALSLSAIVSSFLAFLQFLGQGSVGGLWYFFGERTFSISTIGISTVNIDQQILRSYAAFPHPNVLAFFLFAVIVFTTMRLFYEDSKKEKIFLSLSALLSVVGIVTTFSRSVLLLLIAFSFYVIYSKTRSNRLRASLVFSILFGLTAVFFSSVVSTDFLFRGIDFRTELTEQALTILMNNPYLGIGLNNFFIHQAPLVKTVTPILFQPPHNIYLLFLLSVGIFGFWILPLTLFRMVKSLTSKVKTGDFETRSFYRSVLIVLLGIIFVGFVDHYFLTLEQGQLISAFIAGLSFAKLRPDSTRERKGKSSKKKT